jgi:hypothetical protein
MHSLLQTWLDTQLREHLDLLYQWSSSVLAVVVQRTWRDQIRTTSYGQPFDHGLPN